MKIINFLGNIVTIAMIVIIIIVGVFEYEIDPKLSDLLKWTFLILMAIDFILVIIYNLLN